MSFELAEEAVPASEDPKRVRVSATTFTSADGAPVADEVGIDGARPVWVADVEDGYACGGVEPDQQIFFAFFLHQQHASDGTAGKLNVGNDVGWLVFSLVWVWFGVNNLSC